MRLLFKDFFRDIKQDLGRFLSMFAIIALGAGFFGGLMMTSPDMKLSADIYYDADYLMDLRLVSTLGLDQQNIDDVSNIDGVDEVMPSKSCDVMTKIMDCNYVMRVQSIPESAYRSYTTNDGFSVEVPGDDCKPYLNRSILVSGQWPQKSDECLLLNDIALNTDLDIGDSIEITSCNSDLDSTLNTKTFKISGFVDNPYYLCSSNLGTTSMGSGRIQQVCYVPLESFNKDLPYSELYITVTGAKNYLYGEDDYENCVNNVKNQLTMNSLKWSNERTERVKNDARALIDKGLDEYNQKSIDAKNSLAEAEDKIEKAKMQIESGQSSINETIQKLSEARSSLDQKEQYINTQFGSSIDSLRDNISNFSNIYNKVNSDRDALGLEWQSLLSGYSTQNVERLLSFSEKAGIYSQSLNSLKSVLQANEKIKKESQDLIDAIDIAVVILDNLINGSILLYDNIDAAPDDQKEVIYDYGLSQIKPVFNSLDELSIVIIDTTCQILAAQNSVLDNLCEQYSGAMAQIADAKNLINSTFNTLTQKQSEINSGLETLEKSYSEFLSSKNEVETKLDEAYQKIIESKNSLDDIGRASFYVLDRSKIMSVESYNNDAMRMAGIASVFPLFFFVVAALVALTTMTRKVEEDRILIGTYKALGFSSASISLRYFVYALIVSLTGSIVGVLILSQILPIIVMTAYSIIYKNPVVVTPINSSIMLLSTSLSVVLIILVTAFATYSTLKQMPALLMIPAAPKAGKKILLERVKPLWNKFNFIWKVTLRNIFRYKKRLFMTVLGIAGCFALLLTGFGVHDSINDIIDINFSFLVHDDLNISYSSDMSGDNKKQLQDLLSDKNYVSDFAAVYQDNTIIKADGKDDINTIFIAPSSQLFDQFRTLKSRTDNTEYKFEYTSYANENKNKKYSLDDNFWDEETLHIKHGAVITEKLATTLKVSQGDTIKMFEIDDIGNAKSIYHEVEVAGICENYVANYIYMMRYDYENSCKTSVLNNYVLGKFATDNTSTKEEFSAKAQGIDGVKSVSFTTEIINTYKEMLVSVDYIVLVLIVCAAALAIIVLYNLTNINIAERIRELATFKVLGFTSRETNLYIHRETIIMSIFGIIVGIFIGTILETFVVVTAEVDQVMFGRTIHLESYIYSTIITLIFTLAVVVLMRSKVKKINMVESLKSVD